MRCTRLTFIIQSALDGGEKTPGVLGGAQEMDGLEQRLELCGCDKRYVFMSAPTYNDDLTVVLGSVEQLGQIVASIGV